MSASVELQLMDSTLSHPLQTWCFNDVDLIRLGRSSENEVQISHPYVSRSHAVIKFHDEEWSLHVLSQNGAYVEGKKVNYEKLKNESVFQLSQSGPFLKFVVVESPTNTSTESTYFFDLDPTTLLQLDPTQRDQDVDEIATSPYFAQLQSKIKKLRNSE